MLAATALCISIIGCSGPATRPGSDGPPIAGPAAFDKVPDAVPRAEPLSKYGNPVSYEVFGKRYYVLPESKGYKERGLASWYGRKFHGRRTSSGETYDMYGMTAAHRTLPLPTYARVTNLDNGKEIIVRINDRGPFHKNRIIDLSYTGAMKLDIFKKGTARVEVVALDPSIEASKQMSRPPQAVSAAPLQKPGLMKVKALPPGKITPASSPEPLQSSGLFLQAGAFGAQTNANKLRQQILAAGINNVEIHQSNSDTLYRVRVGPYDNRDQLQKDRLHLRERGIATHIHSK